MTKITVEATLQALVESTINTNGAVERQGHKIDKIYESVAGNDELGHKGIAERLEELEGHHLSFREKYEKEKSQRAKTWGFAAGLMAVFTIFGKAILLKLGFLL